MHSKIPITYSKHILELYKNPSNFGELKNPTHSATETDQICGDEITVQLIVRNGIIKDIKFSGSGCVISLVSASLLTNKIKNMEIEKIKKLDRKDVIGLLKINLNDWTKRKGNRKIQTKPFLMDSAIVIPIL